MTDTPIDREEVERLAYKTEPMHTTSPLVYIHVRTSQRAADTLRALLDARDADRERIADLKAEVEQLRCVMEWISLYGGTTNVTGNACANRARAALRDTGGKGE